MKYILLFITLVVTCNAGFAQDSNALEPKLKAMRIRNGYVEINSAREATLYFNRATKSLADEDSLYAAFTILTRIYYYDSTSQLAAQCERLLDSIHYNEPIRIRQQLLGGWNWLEDLSNWGVGNTARKCGCEKQIVIDRDTIHFIEDGREIGAYHYKLAPTSDYYNWASAKPRWAQHYVVDIEGLNEQWSIHFRKRDLGGNPTNTKLLINRQFNCVCGCPQQLYEKIIHY